MLWNKVTVVVLVTVIFGSVCGRIMIPYFRKLKTGKFEWYIGDRFKIDGSEPMFGGVVMFLSLAFGAMLGIGSVSNELGSKNGLEYAAAVVLCMLFMLIGAAEDHVHDIKGLAVGLKTRYKIILEFLLCLAFLLFLRWFCADETESIILPFRLGYMNFGVLYYPLMALGMTITVNAVKIHDCFAADTKNSVDGLCTLSLLIYSLGFAAYGNITGDVYVNVFGYAAAAACISALVWNISPSKLICGQSGDLLLGCVAASMAVLSKLHLLVFMAGIGFWIDSICGLIQYAVYCKSKRFILKGNSLHSHLRAKGFSDYKIMIVFSALNVVGTAVGAVFAVYSTKIV